jgi:hypothetical protein
VSLVEARISWYRLRLAERTAYNLGDIIEISVPTDPRDRQSTPQEASS